MKHKLIKLIRLRNIRLSIVDWLPPSPVHAKVTEWLRRTRRRMPAEGYLPRIAQYTKAGISLIIIAAFAWQGQFAIPNPKRYKGCLRPLAAADRIKPNSADLDIESVKQIVLDAKDAYGNYGNCSDISMLGVTKLVENGIDDICIKHDRDLMHWWIEAGNRYVVDAHPVGVKRDDRVALARSLGDERIIILDKQIAAQRELAQTWYNGVIDAASTEKAKGYANNIYFYQILILRLKDARDRVVHRMRYYGGLKKRKLIAYQQNIERHLRLAEGKLAALEKPEKVQVPCEIRPIDRCI